ncbi:hypothetical protein KR032_006267 [Drosophila birchii]|nr:hypothetical protein KR032_006267 [Drosophila birchii]
MLEPCRRYQSRLEPIAAAPTTRTTTRTRRTRRLCVNIQTNGAGPLRSRRRRRCALPDPYYMTSYPPVYETNPWMCADWGSNEQFYSYGNFVNPVNRLYAGEEYGYAPANGFIPPENESAPEFYGNNSGQKAAGDLRNILTALDGYFEEDSHMESKNDVEPDSSGIPEDQSTQNNQLSSILDRICDTIGRLNNYMTAKSNNHEQMDIQLRALPQPVQVLQLPVQPLILPPMPITNSSLCPSNYSYAMEPPVPPCPTESRTYFDRPTFPKERKRKRPAKSISHVYLQSQSCSTDDLNRRPRVWEPSNYKMSSSMKFSSSVSTQDSEKPIEDYKIPSPRPICYCNKKTGSVRTLKRKKPSEDFKIPSPVSVSDSSSPSSLRAPPPSMKSEDDTDRNPEMDTDLSRYLVGTSPPTTSYSSSCDYHRSVGSNLLYSYVEEENEEQVHLEAGEEILDEDEWYRGTSQRLAELEWEQEYFKELQKQSQVSMRDKQQQTDDDSPRNNSKVNIRVTTDKAVSTTDIDGITDREPVKIVRVYKRSSLKPRQRLTNNNQRERKTKNGHKVKFEREPQLPMAPEIITIGRHPMECEDTARTIHRSSRKSSDSPERITIVTRDCEDTGRSINRCSRKRSNSNEKRTYHRDQSY